MKIRIPTHQVQEALLPLSKVINPNNHLDIVSKDNTVILSVLTPSVQLLMSLPQALSNEDGTCTVDIRQFKSAIEAGTAQELELELYRSSLILRCSDGQHIIDLPCQDNPMTRTTPPAEVDSTPLPTGFVSFLLQTLPSASKDPTRLSLQGVDVGPRGIAGTDGKQLAHVPLPLSLKQHMILPQSPLYTALRKYRWISLSHWEDSFAICGAGFKLIMKCQPGTFPRYEDVYPDSKMLDITATLSAPDVPRLIDYLKSIPQTGDGLTEMMVYPNRVELKDLQERRLSVPAGCSSTNLPSGFRCNARYLLRLLAMGHTVLSFSSKNLGPIVATGGTGKYLFMPLNSRPEQPLEMAAAQANQPTTPQLEKPTMTSHLVPTPIASVAINAQSKPAVVTPLPAAAPESTDPLAELAASIAAMRGHLEDLNARLMEAGRKMREALVLQRQKERTYQEATRKLERIRLAV